MKNTTLLKVKTSLTLIILFFSFTAFAQIPEEIQWKHLVKIYAKDSSELILTLNNTVLNGKYKIPFDDGAYALYNIQSGMITGEAFWYSQANNLQCKLYYKKGVRNGLKENYDRDGKVWLRQEYKDGKQHGLSEMYSGGVLSSKSEYKNGKKDGKSYSYMKGKVISETEYKEGEENGIRKIFSPSSETVTDESSYKNGKRDGPQKTFNISDGTLTMEVNYKNGVRDGLTTMYSMKQKKMDSMFQNGEQHGISHMYKTSGEVLFTSYFLHGQKVSKEVYEKATEKN